MATKKATGGRVHQGTPRKGRRLGIKKTGGEIVKVGQILLRQIGSTFHPGQGVKMGHDFTLYAINEGKVNFRILKGKRLVEVV